MSETQRETSLDPVEALRDSLEEWSSDEFMEVGWEKTAAARTIRDLDRAGFKIVAKALCTAVQPTASRGNYEDRHPTDEEMVLHPLSDIRDLDDVVRELGIQDSHVTPAEAVRELKAEIERLSPATASFDATARMDPALMAALNAADDFIANLRRHIAGQTVENMAESNIRYERLFKEVGVALAAPQTAARPDREAIKALASCEGEQYKFEEWAKANHNAMHEHPLHYLFLDDKTNAARQGWKAALEYARAAIATLLQPNLRGGEADGSV